MAATAAIVLTLLPMAIPASAEGPQDQGSVESFFDQHIPDALDEWEIPGATVSVVRGNQVLFRGGYGMSDLERRIAFDPDRTLVRIASITKTFTWTSIMQLQERGSVDLDADVNDYLDNVEVPDTFEAPVTLRSLMTHTSGFEDRTIGLATRTPEEMIPLEQYLMENMPERVRPPGVMTSYSNFGAGLAGQVVSDVSGMSYQDYIEANILTPLDMNHTAVVEPLPAELAPDMARSYRKVDGALEAKPTDYDALPPDGVISTTAGDMAKYMMALLAGTQHQDTPILRSATAELMFNDAFVPASGLDGWTLGFKEWTLGGHRAVMHDGGWEEFVSAMILFPDSDLGLFIAFNGEGGAEAMAEVVSDFVAQFLTSEERAPGSGSSPIPRHGCRRLLPSHA
jgi:CubicO group peptidase (beta-lactamase class C family)